MKLNIVYTALLAFFLVSTACNKQLNLNPYQQIQQDQAITTSTDVQITLIGAYNRMSLQDLYGGGVYLYPDLLATQGIVNWQGTYQQLTQLVAQNIPVNNIFVNNVWSYAYEAINQSNNVLANLSKVDSAARKRVEGEARFIRGMTYFDLVRLFGRSWNDGDPAANPGVPIVLTPTKVIDPSSLVSRASVTQVYQQAITDLSAAETLLPKSNDVYATSYAASAILSRIYLQKGDYPNAAAEATKVLASGVFKLNANFADEFPYPGKQQIHVANTLEDIFAIQVNVIQPTISNYLNTFYAGSENAGRGDIVLRQNFVDEYTLGDTRKSIYRLDAGGVLRNGKFDNRFGNVHIIRLAELYLIRAESNLNISTSSAIGDIPLNDVNQIRARAKIAPLTTLAISDVLTERRHELAFEGGFFLHDSKRTRQNVSALPFNSPKLVFPIPQQEINANSKLVQNPGY